MSNLSPTAIFLLSAMLPLALFAAVLSFLMYIKAKKDMQRINSDLQHAHHELQRVGEVDAYCATAAKSAKDATDKANEAAEHIQKIKEAADEYKVAITREADEYRAKVLSDLEAIELKVLVGMVNVDEYEGLKSDEVKNQLTMLRSRQEEMIKSGEALLVTNTSSAKNERKSQEKQILRCFNAECKSIIEGATVKNVDATRAKIQRSFEAINKIFMIDGVQVSQKYLATKYEELSMIYAYLIKEEEEREQRKAIREQMVEEEKVRREIEQAKKQIEKEESQFSNEIKKLMSYMQKAKDDVERQLYIDKISETQAKLDAVEADKENVLQREQNTRAGFVYIISNIGAFGENVFKIGMTRRLEPMDRIAELSSASVPFPFDVHALIFSEDAPALENILHQHFDKSRMNKVNQRKEFFRVDLEKIKKVVLENHNATVKFVDIPDAAEYRETLRLSAE